MVRFYGIDPERIVTMPLALRHALLQEYEPLRAEEELMQISNLNLFGRTPGDKKGARKLQRLQAKRLRQLKRVLNFNEPDVYEQLDLQNVEPVDFDLMTPKEKQEFEDYLRSRGMQIQDASGKAKE